MSDRLKTMRRIAALQAQQKRLAEWKLAAIAQRKAVLDEERRDLGAFVDGGELVGPLAQQALLQSQRVARRLGQAEVQHSAQAEIVKEAERRLKLTERTAERLEAESRASAERRALEALIESFAGRTPPEDR